MNTSTNITEKDVTKKSLIIWFEPVTKSFRFRVANYFTTDTHTSFAQLSIYIFSNAFLNKATNCLSPKITHMLRLSQMSRLNARCLPILCSIWYVWLIIELSERF